MVTDAPVRNAIAEAPGSPRSRNTGSSHCAHHDITPKCCKTLTASDIGSIIFRSHSVVFTEGLSDSVTMSSVFLIDIFIFMVMGCWSWVVGYGSWVVGYGVWVMGCWLWGVGYGSWGVGYGLWGVGLAVDILAFLWVK